jgi:hypothetical protein
MFRPVGKLRPVDPSCVCPHLQFQNSCIFVEFDSDRSRDGAVGIETGYGQEGIGVGVRVPVWSNPLLFHIVQTGCRAHSTLHPMGTRWSFQQGWSGLRWPLSVLYCIVQYSTALNILHIVYCILYCTVLYRPPRPVTGIALLFFLLCSLCVMCPLLLCSFVCCVLFERGVLFCVICVYLCVVPYCCTTATG